MKEKEYLPAGITEDQFVKIVERAALSSCYKFKFGSHELIDMKQQSMVIAITLLDPNNLKFKPRGEKPIELQLYNFLKVWLHNRLSNWRRDKCCRYPNKGGANQAKFNLNYALPIFSMSLDRSEMFARDNHIVDKLASEEIINLLLDNLDEVELEIYENYIAGLEITENEELILYRAVRKALPGTRENYL